VIFLWFLHDLCRSFIQVQKTAREIQQQQQQGNELDASSALAKEMETQGLSIIWKLGKREVQKTKYAHSFSPLMYSLDRNNSQKSSQESIK